MIEYENEYFRVSILINSPITNKQINFNVESFSITHIYQIIMIISIFLF